MKKILTAIGIISLFCFAQCKKSKPDSNGLPAATQEGKNTLGFLLNGQPWIPQGNNGTANLSLFYDQTYRGGVFNISCYNRQTGGTGNRQLLGFFADSIQQPQRILFGRKNFGVEFYDNYKLNCDFSSGDSIVVSVGFCEITKIDKINGIFSGTFEFTLTKQNCETLKITQGRFDMKF